MKTKFQKCDSCEDITIHSFKQVFSPTRGLRREVIKCYECGRTVIKNRKKGTYVIGGKNA